MKRLLLTGATGFIGRFLRRDLPALGWEVLGTSRRGGEGFLALSLQAPGSLESVFAQVRPDAVVHTAAISGPDEAEREPARAMAINAEAVGRLAGLCAAGGARLIHFSTDLVFDGSRAMSGEDEPTAPISVYGRTKAEAEQLLFERCPGAVALRVCAVYGRSLSRPCFFDVLAAELSAGRTVKAFSDQWRTPTYGPQLASIINAVARRPDLAGLFHWGGADRLTRAEFALLLCEAAGLDRALVESVSYAARPGEGPRPADVSLDSSRLAGLLGMRPMPVREGVRLSWAERAAAPA